MAEETQIVLSVDSTDIERGESALDALAAAGGRAEARAQGLEGAFDRTSAAASGAATALSQVVNGAGSASASLAQAEQKFGTMASATAALNTSAGSASKTLAEMEENSSASAAAAAASARSSDLAAAAYRAVESAAVKQLAAEAALTKATIAAAQAQAAYTRVSGDLASTHEQIAAAASRSGSAQAALAQATLNVDVAHERSAAAAKAYQSTLSAAGSATKLNAYQTQQLSYQLNDLFVQIASGGSPLTALIQQGSQLNGTFGGIGGTINALMSVLTPVRLAIGGLVGIVGGLAYAYEKGASEQREFEKTLITTGNAAGVTADQLSGLAAAVEKIGAGTRGAAAEVLNQLAASGKVGADGYEKLTAAALEYQRVGGAAAEETAKKFIALGQAPLEASLKLSSAEHYLSTATIDAIKALEDQGKVTEAGRVAVEAYADTLNTRSGQMKENLGALQQMWIGIRDNTKQAADAILDIGRADTGAEKIKGLLASLSYAQQQSQGDDWWSKYQKGRAAALRDEIALTIKGMDAERQRAAASAQSAEAEAAKNRILQRGDAYLGSVAQAQREIVKIQQDGIKAGLTQEEIQKRIAFAAQAADVGGREAAIASAEAAALGQIERQISDINTMRATGRLNEIEAIKLVNEQDLKALQTQRASVAAQAEVARSKVNGEREYVSLSSQVAALDQKIQTQRVIGSNKVTEALYKQQQAIYSVIRAQQEEYQQDIANDFVARSKAREAIGLAIYDTTKNLQEEVRLLQIESSLTSASDSQRELALSYYRIELDLKKQIAAIDDAYYDDDGLKDGDRARALSNAEQARINATQKAQVEANRKAAQDSQRQWESVADGISSSFTGALRDAFDNGGNFGESFVKRLGDSLESMLARILQDQLKAMLLSYGSAALGLVNGASDTGTQTQGQLAAAQQLYSLYTTGKSVYGSAANYFGWGAGASGAAASGGGIWGTAGGAATNSVLADSAIGSTGYGASSASASSSGAAGLGTYAAIAYAAYLRGSSEYSKKGFTAESAKAGKDSIFGGDAIGATFSTYSVDNLLYEFGKKLGMSDKWSSILSGATAVAQLIGRNAPTVGGRNIVGTIDSAGFTGDIDTRIDQKGGWFRSDKQWHEHQALDAGAESQIDAATNAIQEQAEAYGKALGLPVDKIENAVRDFNVDITNVDTATAIQRIEDALTAYGDSLYDEFSDALGPIAKYGESAADTVQRVATALLGVNDVFKQINLTALDTSVAGGALATSITDAFGGLESLQTSAGTYYEEFFSETEKAAKSTEALTSAFAQVGLTLPTTREAYRQLVEATDATTEAGQKQLAALLGLSGAFADLVPATEDFAITAAEAAAKLTSAGKDALDKLASDASSLQVALLKAQGDTPGAAALQRSNDLAGYAATVSPDQTEAITAAYDYNEALRKQIDALNEAAQAAEQAAQAEAAVAQERESLVRQLLQLQGDTAGLRAMERAALDESNRALYDRITALQDEQAALAAAKSAIGTAFSAVQSAISAEESRIGNEASSQIQAIESSASASKSALESVASSLDSFVASMRQSASALRASIVGENSIENAVVELEGLLASARNGNQIDTDRAQTAARVISSQTADTFASQEDFIRSQAKNAQLLSDLADVGAAQASSARSQAMAIESAASATISAIETSRDQEIAALESQISTAKQQVEAILGVQDRVLTVSDAINALNTALATYAQIGAATAQGKATDPTTAPTVPDNIEPTSASSAVYEALIARLNAADDSELLTEVKALRSEVVSLREQQMVNGTAAVVGINKLAKLNDKWDADGLPPTRS